MSQIVIKKNGTATNTLTSVMAASKTETLAGEKTFDFTATQPRLAGIACGDIAELDGEPYKIVRIGKSYSAGFGVYAVSCEHVSYALSDIIIEETETATGSAASHLSRLLQGTGFTAGTVGGDGHSFAFTADQGASLRETVIKLAQTAGLEFDFSGYAVNFPATRGGNTLDLPEEEMVTGISVTIEARAEAQSYGLTLRKPAAIGIGDTVHLTFTPMEINVTDRVTAITINPWDTLEVSVTLGGSIPDFVTDEVQTEAETVKLKKSYFGNVISKEDGFVSTQYIQGEPEARLIANGQYFAMQKKEGDQWEDCIYFDALTGKYVFEKDVTFNGALISTNSIKFASLDSNTRSTIYAASDIAESIADGSYTGGTFIDGTSIYSPVIYSDEFVVRPKTAASSGSTKGGFTLKGYYGSIIYDMLNVTYYEGDAPLVNFGSDSGAYARWDFTQTTILGEIDMYSATVDRPRVTQGVTYGTNLPSSGRNGQLFFKIGE